MPLTLHAFAPLQSGLSLAIQGRLFINIDLLFASAWEEHAVYLVIVRARDEDMLPIESLS